MGAEVLQRYQRSNYMPGNDQTLKVTGNFWKRGFSMFSLLKLIFWGGVWGVFHSSSALSSLAV